MLLWEPSKWCAKGAHVPKGIDMPAVTLVTDHLAKTNINFRQLDSLKRAGMVIQCTNQPYVYHPVAPMTTPQVMDILAVQPEHFECTFCGSTEIEVELPCGPFKPVFSEDDNWMEITPNPKLPFFACADCHLLVLCEDAEHLARRQIEASADASPLHRDWVQSEGGIEGAWQKFGKTPTAQAKQIIEHASTPIPYDPEHFKGGSGLVVL